MNDLQVQMIERACQRLVTDYCHFVDRGEAARVADQFTEDGVWASPENTMTGRDAIRRGFERRQASAARMSWHVCDNFKLDVVDQDHAKGVVYLTLFRHDGDPGRRTSPVGGYRDRFVRTPDGWRFSRREIVVSFIGAA